MRECRRMRERLGDRGRRSLPGWRRTKRGGPRGVGRRGGGNPGTEMGGAAGQYEPLRLQLLEGEGAGDSALFREYLDRYHYQRYRVPFGAHLRYLVRSERYPEHVLACLLWTSPAWKLAERDRWIGWRAEQRARNLQFIVNHSRFLILPWVRVKGLASKILSPCAPQLPADWGKRYGYRPLLLETLVAIERFRASDYHA